MGDLHEIRSPAQTANRGWERLLNDLREARTRTELLGAEVTRLLEVERENTERVLALKRSLRQLVDDLEIRMKSPDIPAREVTVVIREARAALDL